MNYGLARLLGKILDYPWGGYRFIPNLIGIEAKPGVPYAEYWMGAHEKAPSDVLMADQTKVPLNELIKHDPERTLGRTVANRYGRLPFLFKVLDAREVLSIQVHPTKSQAEVGFARENVLGIPLDAPNRNYRDDNHKPELQLALGDYWLLHGFKLEKPLRAVLEQIPEFSPLKPVFEVEGYIGLYRHVMEMPTESVDSILHPLAERILSQYASGHLDEGSPDYWVAQALQSKPPHDYDRGIFSIYFLNLVKMVRGQAIFQDAGLLHTTLRGQCMEIMANSDNVIRGGLTSKHIDITQLLSVIKFEGVTPHISGGLQVGNPYEQVFRTPYSDFRLSQIDLCEGCSYENVALSLEIIFVLSGSIAIHDNSRQITLIQGQCAVLFSDTRYQIDAVGGNSVFFRASIPDAAGEI